LGATRRSPQRQWKNSGISVKKKKNKKKSLKIQKLDSEKQTLCVGYYEKVSWLAHVQPYTLTPTK
jgi:hypothetical protein